MNIDSSLLNSKVSWQVLQKPFTSAPPPPACRVLFWQTSDESQFEVKLARAGSIFVAHFDASPLSRPVAPKYIKYYQRAQAGKPKSVWKPIMDNHSSIPNEHFIHPAIIWQNAITKLVVFQPYSKPNNDGIIWMWGLFKVEKAAILYN